MSDAELIEAIRGAMFVIHSNREYALTVLTGYLLIFHFIGAQLTRFQSAFVTVVFSLIYLHSNVENYGTGGILDKYRDILREQSPELVARLGISPNAGFTNEVELLLALIIYLGAILFMLSIRRRTKG